MGMSTISRSVKFFLTYKFKFIRKASNISQNVYFVFETVVLNEFNDFIFLEAIDTALSMHHTIAVLCFTYKSECIAVHRFLKSDHF